MKWKIFTIINVVVFLFGQQLNAQIQQHPENSTSFESDKRVLNHYSIDELNDLKANYPQDYAIYTYYLTQSYAIEITLCDGCEPVDPSGFDISKYEYLRKKDETVVFIDNKHGFILTVYAINTLKFLTPQQEFMLTLN